MATLNVCSYVAVNGLRRPGETAFHNNGVSFQFFVNASFMTIELSNFLSSLTAQGIPSFPLPTFSRTDTHTKLAGLTLFSNYRFSAAVAATITLKMIGLSEIPWWAYALVFAISLVIIGRNITPRGHRQAVIIPMNVAPRPSNLAPLPDESFFLQAKLDTSNRNFCRLAAGRDDDRERHRRAINALNVQHGAELELAQRRLDTMRETHERYKSQASRHAKVLTTLWETEESAKKEAVDAHRKDRDRAELMQQAGKDKYDRYMDLTRRAHDEIERRVAEGLRQRGTDPAAAEPPTPLTDLQKSELGSRLRACEDSEAKAVQTVRTMKNAIAYGLGEFRENLLRHCNDLATRRIVEAIDPEIWYGPIENYFDVIESLSTQLSTAVDAVVAQKIPESTEDCEERLAAAQRERAAAEALLDEHIQELESLLKTASDDAKKQEANITRLDTAQKDAAATQKTLENRIESLEAVLKAASDAAKEQDSLIKRLEDSNDECNQSKKAADARETALWTRLQTKERECKAEADRLQGIIEGLESRLQDCRCQQNATDGVTVPKDDEAPPPNSGASTEGQAPPPAASQTPTTTSPSDSLEVQDPTGNRQPPAQEDQGSSPASGPETVQQSLSTPDANPSAAVDGATTPSPSKSNVQASPEASTDAASSLPPPATPPAPTSVPLPESPESAFSEVDQPTPSDPAQQSPPPRVIDEQESSLPDSREQGPAQQQPDQPVTSQQNALPPAVSNNMLPLPFVPTAPPFIFGQQQTGARSGQNVAPPAAPLTNDLPQSEIPAPPFVFGGQRPSAPPGQVFPPFAAPPANRTPFVFGGQRPDVPAGPIFSPPVIPQVNRPSQQRETIFSAPPFVGGQQPNPNAGGNEMDVDKPDPAGGDDMDIAPGPPPTISTYQSPPPDVPDEMDTTQPRSTPDLNNQMAPESMQPDDPMGDLPVDLQPILPGPPRNIWDDILEGTEEGLNFLNNFQSGQQPSPPRTSGTQIGDTAVGGNAAPQRTRTSTGMDDYGGMNIDPELIATHPLGVPPNAGSDTVPGSGLQTTAPEDVSMDEPSPPTSQDGEPDRGRDDEQEQSPSAPLNLPSGPLPSDYPITCTLCGRLASGPHEETCWNYVAPPEPIPAVATNTSPPDAEGTEQEFEDVDCNRCRGTLNNHSPTCPVLTSQPFPRAPIGPDTAPTVCPECGLPNPMVPDSHEAWCAWWIAPEGSDNGSNDWPSDSDDEGCDRCGGTGGGHIGFCPRDTGGGSEAGSSRGSGSPRRDQFSSDGDRSPSPIAPYVPRYSDDPENDPAFVPVQRNPGGLYTVGQAPESNPLSPFEPQQNGMQFPPETTQNAPDDPFSSPQPQQDGTYSSPPPSRETPYNPTTFPPRGVRSFRPSTAPPLPEENYDIDRSPSPEYTEGNGREAFLPASRGNTRDYDESSSDDGELKLDDSGDAPTPATSAPPAPTGPAAPETMCDTCGRPESQHAYLNCDAVCKECRRYYHIHEDGGCPGDGTEDDPEAEGEEDNYRRGPMADRDCPNFNCRAKAGEAHNRDCFVGIRKLDLVRSQVNAEREAERRRMEEDMERARVAREEQDQDQGALDRRLAIRRAARAARVAGQQRGQQRLQREVEMAEEEQREDEVVEEDEPRRDESPSKRKRRGE